MDLKKTDFISFSLGKQSRQKLPNEFVANFVDATKDYTLRTVGLKNPASIIEEGTIRQQSLDFTAFHDIDIVWKQLYKAMKKHSSPIAAVSFEVSRGIGDGINLCDIVHILHDDFGIDADFRIVKKIDTPLDQNVIKFEAEQYTANLFDSKYINAGGSSWTTPDTTLVPFTKIRIIELPYNNWYGYSCAYLFLVQREVGIETGFHVFISNTGDDYEYLTTLSSFSQYGTLMQNYDLTYDIDDDIGFVFRPYKEDRTWSNVSRVDLFAVKRIAIIDDEVISFQKYEPFGDTDIKVSGNIRGLGYSKKTTHSTGAGVWITDVVHGNTLQIAKSSTFYVKLVPISAGSVGDLESATAIQVTPIFRAQKPYKPCRIEATRNGSNVHVKIYPVLKSHHGAGSLAETAYTDTSPFTYDGQLQFNVGGGDWQGTSSEFDITNSNSFTLNVRHVFNGFYSDTLSLDIGVNDGQYIVRG